jgi:hypothetical protein
VRTLALKKSLHDRVLKPAEERMLAVRLHDIDLGARSSSRASTPLP